MMSNLVTISDQCHHESAENAVNYLITIYVLIEHEC